MSDLCAECCVSWTLLVWCEFVWLQVCVAIVEKLYDVSVQ